MLEAATLFSGIGAPEVAMPHWRWLWHAEIEKFPAAVFAQHHSHSINLGDVTADGFEERAAAIGRPRVIVFGSPCQDFSIAGRRLGLDGARGNLALGALRIIARLKPDWFVFENVPGLLSNWSGAKENLSEVGAEWEDIENSDFAAFLGLVHELGYSGAWTSLDAQYFGLAQRRQRLFFVGHIGDWRGPAAVLLEPDSLCGDYPPRREAGEGITHPTSPSLTASGRGVRNAGDPKGQDAVIAAGSAHRSHWNGGPHPPLSQGSQTRGGGIGASNQELFEQGGAGLVAGAVSSKWAKGTGGPAGDECYNLVADPLTSRSASGNYANAGNNPRPRNVVVQQSAVAFQPRHFAGRERMGGQPQEIAHPLTSENHQGDSTQAVLAFDTTQITSPDNRSQPTDRSPQLTESGHVPAIAFSQRSRGDDGRGYDRGPHLQVDVAPTVDSTKPSAVLMPGLVRRLTPTECERLQGFPDGYTAITFRKKPAADGPRYRALGNSMPVPVLRWILTRIEVYETQVLPMLKAAE